MVPRVLPVPVCHPPLRGGDESLHLHKSWSGSYFILFGFSRLGPQPYKPTYLAQVVLGVGATDLKNLSMFTRIFTRFFLGQFGLSNHCFRTPFYFSSFFSLCWQSTSSPIPAPETWMILTLLNPIILMAVVHLLSGQSSPFLGHLLPPSHNLCFVQMFILNWLRFIIPTDVWSPIITTFPWHTVYTITFSKLSSRCLAIKCPKVGSKNSKRKRCFTTMFWTTRNVCGFLNVLKIFLEWRKEDENCVGLTIFSHPPMEPDILSWSRYLPLTRIHHK